MLEAMVTSLPALDPESLKDFLRGLIDRVVLDASGLAYCIHHKIKLIWGNWWRPQGDSMGVTSYAQISEGYIGSACLGVTAKYSIIL